jgi:hypothetical protein
VNTESWIAAADLQLGANGQFAQRALDQQMCAAVET